MFRRVPVAAAVLLAVVTLLVPAPPATAVAPAAASARAQLTWVVGATTRAPVPAAQIRAHLDPSALAALGGPAQLNAVLVQLGPQRLAYVARQQAAAVVGVTTAPDATGFTISVTTSRAGLIDSLLFVPRPVAPTSWAGVDRAVSALAPDVSAATAVVSPDGTCTSVHALAGDTPRPLGSMFKLYVLGALADAVSAGTAAWDEPLAIRDEWKSLPSGQLQDAPVGTRLPLQRYADLMISISDNTATDHLIHRLGRSAVQTELTRLGNASPARTTPFPTTRELFTLKGYRYPDLMTPYVNAPVRYRQTLLDLTGAVPRTSLTGWTQPRDIDTVEWFGSPSDLCRAFAGLQQRAARPGLAPVAQALSLTDGGLALDPTRYPVTWFKGGSEPGVLTLGYLVRTADGRTVVSSVELSDPSHPLDENAVAPAAQAAIRGAIALATA